MKCSLNICGIIWEITTSNKIIHEYIVDRYRGFLSDIPCEPDYHVMELSFPDSCDLKEKYDLSEKHSYDKIKDGSKNNCHYSLIGDKSTVVYDTDKNAVFFQLTSDIEERIIYAVAVKICEYILLILNRNSVYCLHSSVVTLYGDTSNGIAFVGESGSGKTSLSYLFCKNGEKMTNDDAAFIKIGNDRCVAYKNTQFIGLDENNLNQNFPECIPFIQRKDELDLDKSRINLHQLNSTLYAEHITIKKIFILQKERSDTPNIEKITFFEAYKNIFAALNQFSGISQKIMISDTALKIIDKTEIYYFTPARTLQKTMEFFYNYNSNKR